MCRYVEAKPKNKGRDGLFAGLTDIVLDKEHRPNVICFRYKKDERGILSSIFESIGPESVYSRKYH